MDALEKGDYKTPFYEFKSSAQQGYSRAQYVLGAIYFRGEGVVQNHKASVKWYRFAAEHGDAEAQSAVRDMYRKGQGVVQNYILGHMWFNLAASLGSQEGKRNRAIIAKSMTSADIREAQRLAIECDKRYHKGC